ncbi:hypothetical protein CJF31_00011680 [Rutstroemia sp. NJR-2017a BVV2]|nr:hypothetical protein CJF31_00011680 [Rutstroemia sp. NJR-2017a BVV2]
MTTKGLGLSSNGYASLSVAPGRRELELTRFDRETAPLFAFGFWKNNLLWKTARFWDNFWDRQSEMSLVHRAVWKGKEKKMNRGEVGSEDEVNSVRAASPAVSVASSCTLRGSPEPASTPPPELTQSALPAAQSTSDVNMSGAIDGSIRFSNESDHTQPHPSSFFNECFSFDNIEEIYDLLEVPEEPHLLRPDVLQVPIIIDLEAAEAQADREEQISNLRLCMEPSSIPKRNAEILPPFAEIESFEWKPSELLSAGMLVELRTPDMPLELTEHTFMVIKAVVQNLADDSVRLRGWEVKRTRDLGGLLPKRLNELVFIHEIDADDDRSLLEQSVIEIDLSRVLRTRKWVGTNKRFPASRFNPADVPQGTKEEMKKWVEDNGLLVARWCYISNYNNKVERVAQDPTRSRKSAILRMLTEDECTKGEHIKPDIRRLDWRGPTVLGGASKATEEHTTLRGAGALSVAEAECDKGKGCEHMKRTYTFGDCYCGAGGMTCGATLAGLKVLYGVDINGDAGQTWQKNFSPAEFLEMSVHDFSVLPGHPEDFIVDVLHLSPPCQMFSPVKTRPGQNDESNYASLFGVGEAITKARPRIATLEQTYGITNTGHKETFNALIRMFTDLQYDVSWGIKTFQSYGLPQSRKRLIIIASCPGESLPSFPPYTHYDPAAPSTRTNDDMVPYTTPDSVLSLVPANASNHDPDHPRFNKGKYTPWDASKIITCIMTGGSGSQKGHPSGRRGLTNRELAQLQSVPLWMEFHGGTIRRQIGNMVPPMVGRILLESVRKHLEKVDRIEMEKEKRKKRKVVVDRAKHGSDVVILD